MASSVLSKCMEPASELGSQLPAPTALQKCGEVQVEGRGTGSRSLSAEIRAQQEERSHFVKYLPFDLLEDKFRDPSVLPEDWQGQQKAKMESIQEYLNLRMQDDPDGVTEWMALKNSDRGEPVWATPKELAEALPVWDEAFRQAEETLPDSTQGDTRKVKWAEIHGGENQTPKSGRDHKSTTQVTSFAPEGQSREAILLKPAELTPVEPPAGVSPPRRRSNAIVQPLKEGSSPNQPLALRSPNSSLSDGSPGSYESPPVIMRPRQSYDPSSTKVLLPSLAGPGMASMSFQETPSDSEAESPTGRISSGTGANAAHFQFDRPSHADQSGGQEKTSQGALTSPANTHLISGMSHLQSASDPSKISGDTSSPVKEMEFEKAQTRLSLGQRLKEQLAIQKTEREHRIKQLDALVSSSDGWSGTSLSSDVDEDMIRDVFYPPLLPSQNRGYNYLQVLENIWSLKMCEGLKFEMTANLIRVMQGLIHDLTTTKQELLDGMKDLTTINEELLDETRREYGEHFNLHLIRALEEQPYLPGSGLKRQTLKDNMIYSYAIKEQLHPGWDSKPHAVMTSEGREGPGSCVVKQRSNGMCNHEGQERLEKSKNPKTTRGEAPQDKNKVRKPKEVDIFTLEKVANKIKDTFRRSKKMERKPLPLMT
ncbi:hypothetical protein JHW43_008125 [Diplocarpon mali]|nr:hypothetical protein JHW43_008125 [Diplocarpon mali]